jgi:hypothetical protein
MAVEPERPAIDKPAAGADFVIPIAAILLAIYYFTTILDSPWTAQVTAFFVGVTLIALSLAFLIRALLSLARGQARFSLATLIEPRSLLPQRSILFALTLGSLVAIPHLGFTLTAMLFLSTSMLLLTSGRYPIRICTGAIAMSVVWFVIFVLIFRRRFPLGWLDEQLKALLLPALKSIGLV